MDTWNWLKVTVNTLSYFPQNIYAVFNIVSTLIIIKKCYSSRILETVLNSCVYIFSCRLLKLHLWSLRPQTEHEKVNRVSSVKHFLFAKFTVHKNLVLDIEVQMFVISSSLWLYSTVSSLTVISAVHSPGRLNGKYPADVYSGRVWW